MESFLHAVISYLVLVDPIGVALIFSSLTRAHERGYVVRMAWRAVAISAGLIMLFGFLGPALLQQLGISLAAFRIAGGLLLFHTAYAMVTREDHLPGSQNRVKEVDISVFPMSIPLIAGPGCLTLTVLLFADARQEENLAPVLLGLGLVLATTLVLLLLAPLVVRLLGQTLNSILKRFFGVLLAALSVQFVVDGIRNLLFLSPPMQ